jgi:hypothetical protein
VEFAKFFQLKNTSTREHSLKLHKSECLHDFHKYFFSHRVIDVCIKLPELVVTSASVNMFKNRYDKFV